MISKILAYSVGPVGAAVLGLFTLPLLTWFYSVEDIGRISMLQVFASFFVLLFCLGLDQAYVREYHEVDDKPKLFKQVLLPGLSLLLLVLPVLYVLNPELISLWLYGVPSKYLSAISVFCFVLSFLSRFLSLIVRMEDRALAYSMSQLLPKLFFLLFVLATVWLGFNASTYNLITAHTLSISAVFFVFAWNTRAEWVASIRRSINMQEQRPLLVFGLPLVLGGLASWGLSVMGKLSLRSLSTFEELGIYSVTMSLAGAAIVLSGVFNTIWAPMVFKWISEGVDLDKVNRISGHLLASIYFVVVFTWLFSWVLPYFVPEQYAKIQKIIALCLLGPLLYTLSEATSIGISISRKTGYSMVSSVVAMLASALGNYILVPSYGAVGAATSAAVAFFIFYFIKTELSCLAWRRIPRLKGYIVTVMLLAASLLSAMLLNELRDVLLLWVGMLLLGFFIFRASIALAGKVILQRVL